MSSQPSSTAVFPPGFVWGAATSSFQIEGAAEADGKGPSIWDVFCRQEGTIADGSNGDVVCDHYHRFGDDVALMGDLGLGAYRFSIAWPRVMPSGAGAVNEAGLDFYDRLVDALLAAGITPTPTLYHWDLPQALDETGGWLSRDTAHAFADYAEAVATRLGDRIGTWMTLNEPFVSAHHGYQSGEHAPGHTSMLEALAVSHHLLLAHGLAVERLRACAPGAEVGVVLNFTPADPETDSEADRLAAERVNDIENRWYADAITGRGYPEATGDFYGWDRAEILDGDLAVVSQPIDLLGINYYTRYVISAVEGREPTREGDLTEMGWEIHPASFGRLLRWLHERYAFPRYLITENGCAMPDTQRTADGRVDDQDRIDYYRAHLAEVASAIGAGVPVEGYFAWSLLDNFEWAHGYAKRFGIVEVSYDTLERIPKRSALWYRDVIESGVLPEESSGS